MKFLLMVKAPTYRYSLRLMHAYNFCGVSGEYGYGPGVDVLNTYSLEVGGGNHVASSVPSSSLTSTSDNIRRESSMSLNISLIS